MATEFENFMQQDVPQDVPQKSAEEAQDDNLRDELITLSENGQIKQTVNQIKKANQKTLEKIMHDYKRKHTAEVNEQVTETLISKFSDVLETFNFVDDANSLGQDLSSNQLLKTDLKNIVSYVTPYIPLIGLVCGGVIVGKHVFTKSKPEKQPEEQPEETLS